MALPNSMDYLMNNGIIDFDANAYLNNTNVGGVNYSPSMLGGVRMQAQPKKDGFASTVKSKMTDTNFLKKAATAAISLLLVGVGVCKGKKLWNAAKNYNYSQGASNLFTTAKDGVINFVKSFKK